MYNIGTDIVEIDRIRYLIDRYGLKFISKIFSKNEITYCLDKKDPSIHFAGRFSAKEAIKKAISKSYKDNFFPLNQLSIQNDKNGRPFLSNDFLDSKSIDISISHTTSHAVSFAILKVK